MREKGGRLEEARAALRMRYRRRLAVGAWRDLHNHIHTRIPYVNPSPAAEAKLVAQRARDDLRWQEKRLAVRHRRLDEGEALAHRAGAGRGSGPVLGDGGLSSGGAVGRSVATAFLESVLGSRAGSAGSGGGGVAVQVQVTSSGRAGDTGAERAAARQQAAQGNSGTTRGVNDDGAWAPVGVSDVESEAGEQLGGFGSSGCLEGVLETLGGLEPSRSTPGGEARITGR